ncbi:uncharacterized protein LOC124134437 isoform X1 [Haliotis rufescens]|uniref:uncharacterized protein LOC124134437 isoform X1 n=1 Tax=Haliotis rufescens TaxID=6454 RepID=UPI00201F0086|nr:uncharacterized protein LOC124134437 isoform X1 [Haliotis rufescens]
MTAMQACIALLFCSFCFVTVGVLPCSAVRTYVYKPLEVNFKQAREQCKELGMVVAIADTVQDIEAMNKYLAYLGDSVEAWLGMEYTGKDKQFNWINGESVTAAQWDVTTDDEPDNLDKQTCAVWRRRDNQWDSRECDIAFHLLCSTGESNVLYSTYSVYLNDHMFVQQAAATVTSDNNIECAVSCRALADCVYFSHQVALHQCLLYTSTSTAPTSQATQGHQVWRMN